MPPPIRLAVGCSWSSFPFPTRQFQVDCCELWPMPLLPEGAICNLGQLHALLDLVQPRPATNQFNNGVVELGPVSNAHVPKLGWALDSERGITHVLRRTIVPFVNMCHDITSHDTPVRQPPSFASSAGLC